MTKNQKSLYVKRIDNSNNIVTVDGDGFTIDGQFSVFLSSQWTSIQAVSDGTAWYII